MEKKYLITQEQLIQINHLKSMIETDAGLIKELCKSEKADISYGFELGILHSNLRGYYIDIMELHSKIGNQEVYINPEE